MKTENVIIQDDRSGIFDVLRGMDSRLCFAIGLFVCAVTAFYIPSVMIALTGIWVNNLTMLMPLLIATSVLIVQNLIGNWINKIFLTSIIFATAFDCCESYFTVRTATNPTWHNWWMILFLPTAACVLNAWLFLRFKAATDLE